MNRRPLLFLVFVLTSSVVLAEKIEKIRINPGWSSINVTAVVPYPPEISNETQARALSREAGVVQAQNALLTYVLGLKTKSGKLLSVAEVPSLDLQAEIRQMVTSAPVKQTRWENQSCSVTLQLPKNKLKKILKKN